MATNGLGGFARRLSHLEDQAADRAVRQAAERIAAQTGADPDWLVRRATEIAELVVIHGRERTIEIVAMGAGVTAEQIEGRANRLAASVA